MTRCASRKEIGHGENADGRAGPCTPRERSSWLKPMRARSDRSGGRPIRPRADSRTTPEAEPRRPVRDGRASHRDRPPRQRERCGEITPSISARLFVENHGAVPAQVEAWKASVVEGQRSLADQREAKGNLGLSVFPGREEMSKPLEIRDAKSQGIALELSLRGQLQTLVVEATVHYRGAFTTRIGRTSALISIRSGW